MKSHCVNYYITCLAVVRVRLVIITSYYIISPWAAAADEKVFLLLQNGTGPFVLFFAVLPSMITMIVDLGIFFSNCDAKLCT